MLIQKVYTDKAPENNRMIEVNPETLRDWADRLETARKISLPGQIITFKIAPELALIWDPEVRPFVQPEKFPDKVSVAKTVTQ